MAISSTAGELGPRFKDLVWRMDRTVYDADTGARFTFTGPISALGCMQSDCPHRWAEVTWAAHPDGGLYQCNLCHDCLSVEDYQRMRDLQDQG